ncbi:PREDICTED: mas-related G-protein coupled receptor member D-like [Elephantulus edwardii]|uniref:mas-related G-protein coupled receptor member D-like n=1 Tax=Elephantulus edwardii TaxID=28737 RepID=UPI0003F089F9|nr:PREDICTED: mas-related G-protein coupled receptor member D-like [Elephantulus edwardii]
MTSFGNSLVEGVGSPEIVLESGMNGTLDGSEILELTLINITMDAWGVTFLILSVLTLLTCVCGMVGNGVVVWLLGFRVQRNPFSVYVLNLAVADFLFLLCLVLVLSMEFLKKMIETYFFFFLLLIIVMFFAYTAGLSLLTVISVQRCLSVLFPIWYKVHRPRHLSTVVCTLLWGLALLMMTLAISFCYTDIQRGFTMDMFMNVLILGIFTPIMILSSVVLFVQIQRRPRAWRRRSVRLFVIILVSVLVFVVCSLPFGIFWTLLYRLQARSYVYYLLMKLSCFTSSLSSSANPFIYFLVGRRRSSSLRVPLRSILSRALQEGPELGGKEMSSTSGYQDKSSAGRLEDLS